MRTASRITAFAGGLAVVFGAALGVGSGVGPLDGQNVAPAAHTARHEERPGHSGGGHGGKHDGPAAGGLQVSDGGYTLDLRTPRLDAGREQPLEFTVRDSDGEPLTAYRTEHGRKLHLILASRDLTTYRHLHPTLSADGTWSVEAALPRAGDYRLLADFRPAAKGAKALTLGTDLAVRGTYAPRPLPERSATATVDGYTVHLEGTLRPGKPSALELTVTRDGEPVTDLQPHLGAYGHLVALRSGDLAYLHVHPNGEPGDGVTRSGPGVSFTATAPSTGAYRLFLDFRHDGEVRTAAFTAHAGPHGPDTGTGTGGSGGHGDDGHGH